MTAGAARLTMSPQNSMRRAMSWLPIFFLPSQLIAGRPASADARPHAYVPISDHRIRRRYHVHAWKCEPSGRMCGSFLGLSRRSAGASGNGAASVRDSAPSAARAAAVCDCRPCSSARHETPGLTRQVTRPSRRRPRRCVHYRCAAARAAAARQLRSNLTAAPARGLGLASATDRLSAAVDFRCPSRRPSHRPPRATRPRRRRPALRRLARCPRRRWPRAAPSLASTTPRRTRS